MYIMNHFSTRSASKVQINMQSVKFFSALIFVCIKTCILVGYQCEFADLLDIYVACPKSPVTNTFYSERIAGTNNSFSCRINDHIGTYFTVPNDTHFKNLAATVTSATLSGHDRSKSNYAKCIRNFYFSQSAKST